MSPPLRLRSTANCTNTPRVLYALEESGAAYQLEVVPDGTFLRAFGIPGPELVDDHHSVVEVTAVLRHVGRRFGAGALWPADPFEQAEVDRWIDFQSIRVSRAMAARDTATLTTLLGAFDRHLTDRAWVLGERLTVADCNAVLMLPKRAALTLETYPAIRAYLDRLAARPAWARAQARAPRS